MDLRSIKGVVVDAGHGGDDPGAVSGNLKEKDFSLQAALYMYDRLRELGIPAVLTRDTDKTLTRNERINNALNAFGKNTDVILVSNHINAGGGEGAEVVYALRNDATLAESILNNIGEAGQVKRKVYQRRLPENQSQDYYYIIRQTNPLESVLVEYGFIDNYSDAYKLQNNLLDYVEGAVKAIANYAEVKYTPPRTDLEDDLYLVKSGDTLYSIAKKFNTTVDTIKKLNNLSSNTLSVGQPLIIKEPDDIVDIDTYIVQRGDTLYSIAKRFNTSVSEIKRINNLTSDNLVQGQVLLLKEQVSLPEDNQNIYIVKNGDTLYSIAKKYNTTVNEIKRINNLTSNVLTIGQQLLISNNGNNSENNSNEIYLVQPGDSLYSIAKKFNVTVEIIKKINNLNSNLITIGQQLLIPSNNLYF